MTISRDGLLNTVSKDRVHEHEPKAGKELPENASVHTTDSEDPEDEIERLVAYRSGHGFCVRWAGFDAT